MEVDEELPSNAMVSRPFAKQTMNAAWDIVVHTLNSLISETPNIELLSKELPLALRCTQEQGMSFELLEWFLFTFEKFIRVDIVPRFWDYFKHAQVKTFWKFPNSVDICYTRLLKFSPVIVQLQALVDGLKMRVDSLPRKKQIRVKCLIKWSLNDQVLQSFAILLFLKWPVDFRTVLVEYYSRVFNAFQYEKQSLVKSPIGTHKCSGCDLKEYECACKQYLQVFHITNDRLFKLQLLDHVVGDVPISVAEDHIAIHIAEACRGSLQISYLVRLKEWIAEVPLKWLSYVYSADKNEKYRTTIVIGYKERLMHAMYEAYANVRLKQMFNVIIEFPFSQSVLEDLKECIQIAGLRPTLIISIREMLEKRLLHPGVNTADILTAYISAIKALKVLDSSGVVLQLVCEPVCKYLRSREDTVRCIVSSLTDESCDDLAGELLKATPVVLEDSYISDEDEEEWDKWKPTPVEADPAKITKGQRTSDIISMLVNIYGSKELFVNEYRTLLADRLLTTFSYQTEKEMRNLELLKRRFGESQLHFCEVMLKDINDSRRISNYLAADFKNFDFAVNAMILSAQFWPPFKEEKLKLPERISQHLERYTEVFQLFKGNRTLEWKPHLGTVSLEIEFDEGTILEFSVSPVHATIVWYFQEKSTWNITELSSVMQIQPSVLRRKIAYWQSHGILKETEPDVFVLIEEQKGAKQDTGVIMEEEAESVTASSQDQREEELQTFWSFIIGMLTNMESLPLERIHSMLRMFALPGPSTNELSLQGMKQFLDQKVKERKLQCCGGFYKLPKTDT